MKILLFTLSLLCSTLVYAGVKTDPYKAVLQCKDLNGIINTYTGNSLSFQLEYDLWKVFLKNHVIYYPRESCIKSRPR